MKKTFILLFVLVSLNSLFAQDAFEGTLVYAASYTGDHDLVKRVASSMPDTMEWQFQEGKSFFEMRGGMAAMLMNRMLAEKKGGDLYMIATAQNMNYKFTEESRKQAWENPTNSKAQVEKGKKDMELAGIACKHYLVIQDTRRGRDTMEIWAAPAVNAMIPNTNDLTGSGLFSVSQYGIEGFPMKIVHPMPVPGKTIYINLEIAQVLKDEVEASRLTLPAAYQLKEYNMVPPKR